MEEEAETEQPIPQDQQDQQQPQTEESQINAPNILPEQITSLDVLLKNKTASEVARDLVYNKDKQLSSLKKKYGQNSQINSQQSSQQYGKGSNYIQSYIQRSIIQNQTSSQYEGQPQDQNESVLTKISQKLFQELPKYIKQKYQGGSEQPCAISHSALRIQKDKGVFSSDVIEKTQGELMKESYSIKEQQEWYKNSVVEKQNYVQQKKIALVEEQKEKERQQCTFQPKILPCEQERECYFWEKQAEVQKMYDEKKEILSKDALSKQQSNVKKKPEISKETNELADQHFKKNHISKPVFDRLYSTKNTYANTKKNPFLPTQQTSNEKMIQLEDKQQKFSQSEKKALKPSSAVAGEQRRDNLLYMDAKRRQEQKQLSSKKEKQQDVKYQSLYPNQNLISKQKKEEQSQQKIGSRKSNLTFNQKFLKEMFAYIKQICFPDNQFENDEMYLEQQINNEEYFQIMQLLRFVSMQYQRDEKSTQFQEQEKLLNEIWELLEKLNVTVEEETIVQIKDFIVVILLFINFKMIEKGDFSKICQLLKEIVPSLTQVFQKLFQDNNYKHKQLLQLSKRFQQFLQNRLYTSTSTDLKEGLMQQEEEKYSYHPQISQISVSLANKKKEKIKNEIQELQNEIEQQGELKEYDQNLLLGYQKLKSDQDKEKMRQEIEYNEMAECTFQPNSFKDQLPQNIGIKKSDELHAQAQMYHQSKRVERSTYDVEYERNCDQCTFQPDIHFYQSSFSTSSRANPTIHAEDSINKNIQRIKEARQKKLLEEQIKQQGHTMNDNKRIVQKQSVELAEEGYIQSLREHRPQPQFQQNNYFNLESMQKSLVQSQKKQPEPQIMENQQNYRNQQQYNPQLEHQIVNFTDQQEQEDDNQDNLDDNNNQDNLDEPAPLLFVDVNIEEGQASRIIVREGDTAPQLAESFAREHNLDASLQQKLQELLEQQIKNLLTKIEEEEETSENPNQFA